MRKNSPPQTNSTLTAAFQVSLCIITYTAALTYATAHSYLSVLVSAAIQLFQ